MSLEENKAIARRFFEELHNQQNLDVINEIMAPTWVSHHPDGDDDTGLEAFRKGMANIFETSPDIHDEICSIVAEGDRVAVLHTRTGTFQKQFGDLPPTGKKLSMWMFHHMRIADGKIAEEWLVYDSVAFEKFLGTYGKND